MNRPKVSLPILLPWEKATAYCRGSTIQIYYSPHSLSAKKKACTKLQISKASENNYFSGRESQRLGHGIFPKGKERKKLCLRDQIQKISLLRNLCQRGTGKTLTYKRKPRARDTERRGVPLWNDWNAWKGKILYWPSCLICMSKATSAI